MIKRQLLEQLKKRLFSHKAIVLTGPRQVGKTTLIRELIGEKDYLFLDGDDVFTRSLLNEVNTQTLLEMIGNKPIVFIDECQRIENVGLTSKIIVDQIKTTQLILSGSSSFEINEKIKEPLTGRKWPFELYPISYIEWENHIGILPAMQSLAHRLVYGFYPDVLSHQEDEEEILKTLVDSYLYKDVLQYGNIKKPDMIIKLVQALSFQVGNEVNYHEVAGLLGIDPKTVVNYLDVLEKAFVVFRLNSYSKNQRNEIKKGVKIYFYDNGVRNAVIKNFNAIENRNDIGALWENFLISEKLKQNKYAMLSPETYFWRTSQQQEIDYIEIDKGQIHAYDFKWNPGKKGKISDTFTKHYNSVNHHVNRENYREFLRED